MTWADRSIRNKSRKGGMGMQGHQENSIWAVTWENFTVTCTDWVRYKNENRGRPLLRATATCLGNDEHYLVLTPNHHLHREHQTPSAQQEERRKRKKRENFASTKTVLQKKKAKRYQIKGIEVNSALQSIWVGNSLLCIPLQICRWTFARKKNFSLGVGKLNISFLHLFFTGRAEAAVR